MTKASLRTTAMTTSMPTPSTTTNRNTNRTTPPSPKTATAPGATRMSEQHTPDKGSRKLSLKRGDAADTPRMEERLHKVLAQAGLGSRRALEQRIADGL